MVSAPSLIWSTGIRLALSVIIAVVAIGGTSTSASTLSIGRSTVGPKAYYLALGDSSAYSFQPNWDLSHGYTDDLYAHLRAHGTSHFTNLSCLAETSSTFLYGGCFYWFLRKSFYLGSQITAALDFLSQHRGQVSPVTLDIGGVDMLLESNSSTCTVSPDWQQALAAFDVNLKSILAWLTVGLQGQGDLVVLNYPYLPQNCRNHPELLTLLQRANHIIEADAAQYGARVADTFDAFGGTATSNSRICSYTWLCSSYHDIHPSSLGYRVMASAIEKALGY